MIEAFVRLPDLEQRIFPLAKRRSALRASRPRSPDGESRVPGLGVQGILDAVERVDGRLRALDWKTSASRAGWDAESLKWHAQGSIYAWASEGDSRGTAASDDVAFCIGLKLKEPLFEDRVAQFPKAARERALLTLIAAAQSMERATPFPHPGWMCNGCAFSRRCDAWQSTARIDVRRDPFAA